MAKDAIKPQRIRLLQNGEKISGPVIYWMCRDQRISDNWALLHSIELAKRKNTEVGIVFNLLPEFLDATLRQYDFMLQGLKEVEEKAMQLNIPFYILTGSPATTIPEFIRKHHVSILVTDFDPLRVKRLWKRDVARNITIPFLEVDAHNIVPCLIVSDKVEYAAYTLRPKIKKLFPDYLDDFPEVKTNNPVHLSLQKNDWHAIYKSIRVDELVKPVPYYLPGAANAGSKLNHFLGNKLPGYDTHRNDPTQDALSNLSPYLHFGQISAQRIVIETIRRYGSYEPNSRAFLEELIVRRELSDNFCYFNKNYDRFEGFHTWAKKTLNEHRKDDREFIYSIEDFEHARTHDDLWNAAQNEMRYQGKMHGYMRMYWAKKILEWTDSPEQALRFSIRLNDKYSLDGRDPNGYVGCAWSVGGVHDRAWAERPVFGKIRYMNYKGAKRKFDIKKYIKQHSKSKA